MSSQWASYELPKLDPAVSTAVDGFKTLVDTLLTTLRVIKGLLETMSVLEVKNLSESQLAIQTAIASVDGALASITKDSGIYMLVVPPRKKVLIAPQVAEALQRAGLKSIPPPLLTGDAVNIKDLLVHGSSSDGGNNGFMLTVAESLTDKGDANKPAFKTTDAVAGLYLVAGAADYLQLLSFLTAFNALISPRRPATDLEVPGLPIPRGLKARASAAGVQLNWEYQAPLVEVPTLGASALITNVAIIRSQDPNLMGRVSIPEIFGKTQLAVGDSTGKGRNLIEVVAVLDYKFTNSYHHDTTLEGTTPHYYAASYGIKTGTSETLVLGKGTVRGYGGISGVAKIAASPSGQPARSIKGVPPDWVRTKKVVDIIPDVSALLSKLTGLLGGMSSFSSGADDMLKTYITHISNEITSYEVLVEDITGTVTRLNSLFNANPDVGVYSRTFEGVGGNQYFLKDLSKALSDKTDPLRPPFDRGDEAVSGMIVLMGGPSLSALKPVQELLSQILGLRSGQTVVEKALAEIDKALSVAEAQILEDGILAGSTPDPLLTVDGEGNCGTVTETELTFDDALGVVK